MGNKGCYVIKQINSFNPCRDFNFDINNLLIRGKPVQIARADLNTYFLQMH